MQYKFYSYEANRLCYDINVIFDQQPTDFLLKKTNPQLRQLERVLWKNIPLLIIAVDERANVILHVKFHKWTQPFINRLKEFEQILEPFERIIFKNKILKISSRTFVRAFKILIGFIDSSQQNRLKFLMKKEISMTVLLRDFFQLAEKINFQLAEKIKND